MQCFQNRVLKWVTPGRDSRDRLVKMKTLPVQMFLELKNLLFFNKIVSGCFSFNFDNFITRNQANDHNLRYDMVYSHKTNLVLSEQKFFCSTSKYANILARKYSIKIKMDPILFIRDQNYLLEICFPKCKHSHFSVAKVVM